MMEFHGFPWEVPKSSRWCPGELCSMPKRFTYRYYRLYKWCVGSPKETFCAPKSVGYKTYKQKLEAFIWKPCIYTGVSYKRIGTPRQSVDYTVDIIYFHWNILEVPGFVHPKMAYPTLTTGLGQKDVEVPRRWRAFCRWHPSKPRKLKKTFGEISNAGWSQEFSWGFVAATLFFSCLNGVVAIWQIWRQKVSLQ